MGRGKAEGIRTNEFTGEQLTQDLAVHLHIFAHALIGTIDRHSGSFGWQDRVRWADDDKVTGNAPDSWVAPTEGQLAD